MNFPGQQIGDFSVTAISDGFLSAPLDVLSNIDPAEAARLQHEAGVSAPSAIHINCYLIRSQSRTVLIDTGAGGFKQWGGKLQDNLRRAGVRPSDIDTVLLTHAHPDHIGGLLNSAGELSFPDAELVLHEQELSFWQNDIHLHRANERARGNFLLARQVFEQYRDRIRTFAGEEVLPGISAQALPGHTAGHCGFRVQSNDQELLIWGDIVHFPHLQISRPEVSIAFDLDPHLAAATRMRLLDIVSADQLLIAGMHLGEEGFVRIIRAGNHYRLVSKQR
ncbi:MBL fold metallo-hydrolase [uncultured Herbaspirillum sp.]|jgi:glyoxylase-like metal-dependent hydrolase (beta-lactamase superfamily II)|uniref:MBL fold metallo-hydrolase n=1 Tax=uncultured Herbaspirillum sp. TaxID=160236 RepID=UPI002621D48B|nr:MBL fold metallo-hydrolase [uncultured Herbaspirillum sp.]